MDDSYSITYEQAPINFKDVAYELIERLRITSDLSYEKCIEVARIILNTVVDRLGIIDLNPLCRALNKDLVDVENSSDSHNIQNRLQMISGWRLDHQERNWSLLEDESLIVDGLIALDDLMAKADKRVSIYRVEYDECVHLIDLISLYQMEARFPVRFAALKAVKSICLLHPKFIPFLLSSVLPSELTNELTSSRHSDEPICLLSAEILAILFCTGEPIPVALYDIFSVAFMNNILNRIESGEVSQCYINFLLSFNLHEFVGDHVDKTVLTALKQREINSTRLAEGLLHLVNIRPDPTWPYSEVENHNDPSALVLTECVLSDPQTAQIFYHNDALVLLDVISREILNLPCGKRRTAYLRILLNLCKNVDQVRSDRLSDIIALLKHLNDPCFDTSEAASSEDCDLLMKFSKLGIII